jgi:SAM-dependent methyltransferase
VALDWEERYAYARDPILPWVERTVPLAGRTVVEFGCGNGPVTCAIAERAGSIIALDIDVPAVEDGRRRAAALGLEPEFLSGSFEELLAAVRSKGRIDVFFLFAVLEHMTIDERLRTLAVAREAVGRDGFIVVCETPNRLLPWDYHTSQLPFFGLLPDELALRYLDRSERSEFTEDVADGLATSEAVGGERLIRWGRGVSFHEFELAFSDFPANVVACNYEPELLPIRELYPEELALARLLRRVRPDIPPSFTRYWLDLVIAGNADRPRRFFEPWPFETTKSAGVDLTEWDTLLFRGPGSWLRASLDPPGDELVVGFQNHPGRFDVRISVDERETIVVPVPQAQPGEPVYTSVDLPRPAREVTLEPDESVILNFLGFAADR